MNAIDHYIEGFQPAIQKHLIQIRSAIKKAAPGAEEVLSYGMPTYKQNGVLVYFAGHTNHIGFYPMAKAIIEFKEEIASYKTSKGTIQFPIDKPIPTRLITKIIKFRLKENNEKAKLKSTKY